MPEFVRSFDVGRLAEWHAKHPGNLHELVVKIVESAAELIVDIAPMEAQAKSVARVSAAAEVTR